MPSMHFRAYLTEPTNYYTNIQWYRDSALVIVADGAIHIRTVSQYSILAYRKNLLTDNVHPSFPTPPRVFPFPRGYLL